VAFSFLIRVSAVETSERRRKENALTKGSDRDRSRVSCHRPTGEEFSTEIAESGTVLQVVNATATRDSPLTPIERDVSSPREIERGRGRERERERDPLKFVSLYWIFSVLISRPFFTKNRFVLCDKERRDAVTRVRDNVVV